MRLASELWLWFLEMQSLDQQKTITRFKCRVMGPAHTLYYFNRLGGAQDAPQVTPGYTAC